MKEKAPDWLDHFIALLPNQSTTAQQKRQQLIGLYIGYCALCFAPEIMQLHSALLFIILVVVLFAIYSPSKFIKSKATIPIKSNPAPLKALFGFVFFSLLPLIIKLIL